MWGGVLSLETWIHYACRMGRSVLGKPSARQRATYVGRVRRRIRARGHNSLLHDSRSCPWTPQPLGWLRGSRRILRGSCQITCVTSDHMGHIGPRGSRRITCWEQTPPAGAATWGVLCGVSPPNSPQLPKHCHPVLPVLGSVLRQLQLQSPILKKAVGAGGGPMQRYLPPREECDITELASSLAFLSLSSLSL